MLKTIQLQSIGKVPAVEASELKAGDLRLYNFGSTGLVVKVIEKTPKTLSIITFENGKYFITDIRKTTLVAIYKRDQDVSMHNPKEAFNPTGKNKGMVDVSEYFQTVVAESQEKIDINSEQVTTPEVEIVSEKIKVKSITFEWSESPVIKDNTIVSTFSEASDLITNVAFQMGSDAGYRKTSFIIEWVDGRTHNGRIDVQFKDAYKKNAIGEHVKYFYEGLAGLRKPCNWTDKEYKNHLQAIYNIGEKEMQEVREILNTYLLEDAPSFSPTPDNDNTKGDTEQNDINIDILEAKIVYNTTPEETPNVFYSLNDEKSGIEIKFNEKPSSEILDQLKINGFRWSKYSKLWYAKQSEERIQFVKSLCNEKVNNSQDEKEPEVFTYPEIEINDIETYIIDKDLQKREHDSSFIFRKNEIDRTKEIQDIFQNSNDKVIDILKNTDNARISYYLKRSLQSFKKRYYEIYVKMLHHRAANPSWAVTGRGGLNVSRYNKKMDRYDKLMGESVEISNIFETALKRAKNDIRKDKDQRVNEIIKEKLNNTTQEITFTSKQKEFTFMNYKEKKRAYIHGEYWIVKTWGCFRIFKGNKEVHSMKTTQNLEDTKKYATMLILSEQEQKELVNA